MRALFALISAAAVLGGCTTTSFAPPHIEKNAKLNSVSRDGCTNVKDGNVTIQPDVIGGLQLIENFELSYQCAADEAADGRQIFEVPSFLAAAAGLAGASFGLSADQILVTGLSASVLNGGKSYYAPKAKAGMLQAAVKAVNCIGTEAVGISYFRQRANDESTDPVQAVSKANAALLALDAQRMSVANDIMLLTNAQGLVAAANVGSHRGLQERLQDLDEERDLLVDRKNQAVARAATTGVVELDAERQYFEMVKRALGAVHGILGEQLRDAGDVELKDVYAQLKELVKEEVEQEEDLEEAIDDEETATGRFLSSMRTPNEKQDRIAAQEARKKKVQLENAQLQTRLQICVLQARVA